MMATLFVHPITLMGDLWQLLLVIPLCVSVSIVYKTVRTNNLSRLWLEILILISQILGGVIALAAVLWAIHSYWPR